MTTQTETLKLALEALERMTNPVKTNDETQKYKAVTKAIFAIKEALSSPNGEAQPEPLKGLKLIHKADIDLAKKSALEAQQSND